jgi:hypothetical protein
VRVSKNLVEVGHRKGIFGTLIFNDVPDFEKGGDVVVNVAVP